jgi:hypothetical protein
VSISSNRTKKEKEIIKEINLLKLKQRYHRKKWLSFDIVLSDRMAKLDALYELRKTHPKQKKKRGDGYACKTNY